VVCGPVGPTIEAYVNSVTITLNGYNDAGGWFDGATIEALDPSNTAIASQTVTIPPTSGTSYGAMTITFTGQIHELQFNNILNPIDGGQLGIFPFDNLTFGAETDVPEPSTLLLMGSLIMAAGLARRGKAWRL
jgi:hypothetical protein